MQRLLPLLVLAAAPAAPALGQGAGLFVKDQPLPDLELPTIDGSRTINLSQLKGTPTLLIQFASW